VSGVEVALAANKEPTGQRALWLETLQVRDLRNIARAELRLSPGLNVLFGRNAQGKTSLLEAVALLARGRSFRTDETYSLIRRGAHTMSARGVAVDDGRHTALQVELAEGQRRLRLDDRDVRPGLYYGHLDVVVYSTDRLRAIRGSVRERRAFIDRSAAALWPSYRRALRDFERVVAQRNGALEQGARGLEAWDERFVDLAAELRHRRERYVERLSQALEGGFAPSAERYEIALSSQAGTLEAHRALLSEQLVERRAEELAARRCLVGPHRDRIALRVDGEELAAGASSGQARSLLLALTLASMEVYRAELGTRPLALLDDLDSELDEERAGEICEEVSSRGQALVTTTHPGWASCLAEQGTLYQVSAGQVARSPGKA
jgi:DNA replication and repair protein RecF